MLGFAAEMELSLRRAWVDAFDSNCIVWVDDDGRKEKRIRARTERLSVCLEQVIYYVI